MFSEIKAGAMLNYFNTFLRIGITFFLTPFILTALGKNEYGLYIIAGTIVSYIALMDFGLTASTARFLSEYQAKGDASGEAHFLGNITALFTIIAIAIFSTGCIIYFFLEDIFPNFSIDELSTYKILYILALLNTAFCFPLNAMGGILTSRNKFIVPGLVRVLLSITNVIGTIIILGIGYKSIALLLVNVTTGILALAINSVYAFTHLKVRMSWHGWDLPLCKKVYSFSGWVFLSYVSGVLNWGTGTTILGITCTPSDIAVYSFGSAIFSYYLTFSSTIPNLFTSKAVSLVTNNHSTDELTRLMSKVGRVQVFILLFLLSGIVLYGSDFIQLWVGDTLKERVYESWYIALILCSGVTIPLIQNVGVQILQAKNKVKCNALFQIFISSLCVFIAFITSSKFGTLAVAYSVALSYILGQACYTNWIYHKIIGINILTFFKLITIKLPVCLFISLSTGYLLNLSFPALSWISLATKISIFTITYTVTFIYIYLNKDEQKSYIPFIFSRN